MDLNISNIDITKTDLNLRHVYEPQVKWNLDNPKKDRVTVDCEHLKVGERVRYATVSSRNMASVDFNMVFREKVFKINGLSINGKPITSPTELSELPAIPELDALVIDVVSHIMTSDSLNKDEVKN